MPAAPGFEATQHGKGGLLDSESSLANTIGIARPFALSTLFHLAVLVLLGFIAGSAGTGRNQPTPPDRPRLTVRLATDVVNVDVKQPPRSVIDPGAAAVATDVRSEKLAANGDLAGPALIALPVDIYYTASEVDARATPITAIELESEEVRLLAPNAIGKTVLKLWIDEKGKVEKVSPLASDMSSTITDQAIAAFSNTRYQPATRQGQAVKTISIIEIDYSDGH